MTLVTDKEMKEEALFGFQWTAHALRRWRERCPDLNMELEMNTVRPVKKGLRKLIRETCKHNARYLSGVYQGYYYLYTRSKVVLVVKAPKVIKTVLRYFEQPKEPERI